MRARSGIAVASILAKTVVEEKSEAQEAMDMHVAADGARAAAWFVRKFKRLIHKLGAFQIHIEAQRQTPDYVRVALEKFKRSPHWDVTKWTKGGSRKYRVRWLAWGQNTVEARTQGWGPS